MNSTSASAKANAMAAKLSTQLDKHRCKSCAPSIRPLRLGPDAHSGQEEQMSKGEDDWSAVVMLAI